MNNYYKIVTKFGSTIEAFASELDAIYYAYDAGYQDNDFKIQQIKNPENIPDIDILAKNMTNNLLIKKER